MTTVLKYFRLWVKLTMNSFLSVLSSRLSAGLFLLGKSLRFIFFGIFLWALFAKVTHIAEYSFLQALFFYLTFNFIDTVTQLFFREVYRFRQLVVSGDFDLVLVKPTNPLFRALAGGADPLDVLMLIPYIGALVYVFLQLKGVTMWGVSSYVLLVTNGLVIATGFHILVLALAIMTTEVDHAIMIYRDLTSMGRVPVDIYQEPLRGIITFVIPIGIMMTFPAKALFGLLTPGMVALAVIVGVGFLVVCLRLWRFALTQYASASS
ncbi:MAG: ABC-2 family transporter protein [Patescibacteria group bacterium]